MNGDARGARGWACLSPSARVNVALFWLVQASALLVLFVPFQAGLLALCAASYTARMAGITVGFHRLLAHGAFRTTRAVRFALALLGTAAMQKGPLWWAGNHVHHHRFADRAGDPHSPLRDGFYHAHQGWFLDDMRWDVLDGANPVLRAHRDCRELHWLERFSWLPPLALAALSYAAAGWPGLAWGFCLPTVLLAHATFAINSVNHLWGSRRFATPDGSRNNFWTALLTLGEGWHNNHHRSPRSARSGLTWAEPDCAYALIRLLERLGLAWDLKPVPAQVLREAQAAPLALEQRARA